MAQLRFKAKVWKTVAAAIDHGIMYYYHQIEQKKERILNLQVSFKDPNTSIDSRIEVLEKTLHTDLEYKKLHPDEVVQGGYSIKEMEAIIKRIHELKKEIAELEETISVIKTAYYFIVEASKKADTVLDAERHIPTSTEKEPFTGDWGIFSDAEKELWDKIPD